MKVAVTGASGHVGINLIDVLLHANHQVRVMKHRNQQAFENKDVEIIPGDLGDPASLALFCEGMEAVVHLGARISIGHNSYKDLFQTNVEGTQNIVKTAREAGVKRFIHFSTIHTYNHHPMDEPMDETRPPNTGKLMPYEQTKLEAEQWVLEQNGNGMEMVVLNPTAIMGPQDLKPSFTGKFLIQLYEGKLPGLVRGGYYWVDVRDVCQATLIALEKSRGGEKYILAGHYRSAVGVAKLMEEVTGKKINKQVLPLWLAHLGVPFIYLASLISGEEPIYTSQSLKILQEGSRNIRSDKAGRELDFHPRPLAETLRDTIEWFKQNKYIKS